MSAATFKPVPHKGLITLSVMLSTIMQVLDTTIANVALPHMQGSLAATQDQVSWVLTSYIIASAIMTLPTGWMAGRFGRKKVFLISIAGFTLTSMLCGAATSITQMVVFRLAQGAFGAALVPIAQSVMLDINPKEKHGQAMALWGLGVMVGPILGPTLGGYLTEYYNWRWVFYINVPFGLMCFLGIWQFLPDTKPHDRPFDFFGFFALSLALGALQLLLDRGQSEDWFQSIEIRIYFMLILSGTWMYVVHAAYARHPFLSFEILKDRLFMTAAVFIFFTGIILLATIALLPPFMQVLMNYPVIDVGLTLAPRGIGTAVTMVIVGKLLGKVDVRLLIFTGLALTAYSLWEMSLFSIFVPEWMFVMTGIVQGFGLGFIFVPLSTIAYSTLPPHTRTEAAGIFSLMRNLGSSIGVSVVIAMLSGFIQMNHTYLGESLTVYNVQALMKVLPPILRQGSGVGYALLDGELNRQAALISYLNDFRFMMWTVIAVMPLIIFLRVPKSKKPDAENIPAMVAD
ncbi:MAG: MDR family MFS transporter [Pseudomonadota bacterium]